MSSLSTALSPQGRKRGAQLAVTGLREDFAAARGDEKAGGERFPAREDWGLTGRDESGASSLYSCSWHTAAGTLGRKTPGEFSRAKRDPWVLSPRSSTLMQEGPFIWD